MKMRAKMRISHIGRFETSEILHFRAVGKPGGYPADGLDEDNTYAMNTPSADITMHIANPALVGTFKPGEKYYVTFVIAD